MAKKVLLSTVVVGARRYYAGTLLDESAEAATIAAAVAAGGQLLDEGDPIVDAAASVARQKLRDGHWREVDGVMLAAVARSAHAAAQVGGPSPGPQRDLFLFLQQSESTLTTCPENAAAAGAFNFGEGSRNGVVVFPAGWDGGDLVWSGTFRGDAVQETFLSPGVGGGTVTGTQLFTAVSGIANTAPGGTGAQAAVIQVGRLVGTTRGGLALVEKVTINGVVVAPASVNLSVGWIETSGQVVQGEPIEIVSVIA